MSSSTMTWASSSKTVTPSAAETEVDVDKEKVPVKGKEWLRRLLRSSPSGSEGFRDQCLWEAVLTYPYTVGKKSIPCGKSPGKVKAKMSEESVRFYLHKFFYRLRVYSCKMWLH